MTSNKEIVSLGHVTGTLNDGTYIENTLCKITYKIDANNMPYLHSVIPVFEDETKQ